MATAEGKVSFEQMLHNPESLPTDPEELQKLIDQGDGGAADPADDAGAATAEATANAEAEAKAAQEAKDKADADAKAKAEEDAKAKADADAKAKADADAKAAAEVAGVATKDGKKVIPYVVLAETRRREDEERRARETAESALAEAKAQAEKLSKELEDVRAGRDGDPKSGVATSALVEKINALKEQVPEVGEVLDEVMGAVTNLQGKLDEFAQRQEADDQRRDKEARSAVQEAIDANPVLSYLQNEKPEMFNEAARLDKALRESPNEHVRSLTMSERFEKVVSMIEDLHGKVELPDTYKPKGAPAPAGTKPADAGAKDAKAGAEVKDGKKVGGDAPITLSDLPGGAPPASGQRALEEMSTTDIENQVNKMLDAGKGVDEILHAYTR